MLLASGDVRSALRTWCRPKCICSRGELAPGDRDSAIGAEIRTLAAAGSRAALSRARSRTRSARPKPLLANSYRAGVAEPAHVPDADGIFQPDSGGELGIEPAVLRGAGGRSAHAAGGAEPAGARNGPSRRWSVFSPRIWRTGRRCCARCGWWATMCGKRRANRWLPTINKNEFGGRIADVIRRLGLIFLLVALAVAQDRPTFRVKVDMVVL